MSWLSQKKILTHVDLVGAIDLAGTNHFGECKKDLGRL